MRPLIKAGLLATLLLTSAAWAQTTSPVGLWKTIDDESGRTRSAANARIRARTSRWSA
jgi:hypothetical protein